MNSTAPIVLLHGLLGFDKLLLWRMFDGVAEHLRSRGFRVVQPLVHPTAGIRRRAEEIVEAIDREAGAECAVHLVGHSMGGLDARCLASPGGLGLGARVRTVTTICSPHRGSPAAPSVPLALRRAVALGARAGARLVRDPSEKMYLKRVGDADWDAFRELEPGRIAGAFNPLVVDDPRVTYYSYAADLGLLPRGVVMNVRRRASRLLNLPDEPHDGLVTVESAKWGRFLGALPADHGSVIGLRILPWVKNSFDHLPLFEEIAERVSGEHDSPLVGRQSVPSRD